MGLLAAGAPEPDEPKADPLTTEPKHLIVANNKDNEENIEDQDDEDETDDDGDDDDEDDDDEEDQDIDDDERRAGFDNALGVYDHNEWVPRSRIPLDHPYFLTGIFLPADEFERASLHPHGDWRWLTGMPSDELQRTMESELGGRGIDMRGNRHCLLRKYFHALELEMAHEDEGTPAADLDHASAHCFRCMTKITLPEKQAQDTTELDEHDAVKICSRHPKCLFAFCTQCHNVESCNDSYGNNSMPAAFGSYCYFCGSSCDWQVDDAYGM